MKDKKKLGYLLILVFLILTGSFVYGFIKVTQSYNLLYDEEISITPVNPKAENAFGLVYEIKPGGTVKDGFKIKNTTIEDASILSRSLDVADNYLPPDGEWLVKSPDDEQLTIGKWVELENSNELVTVKSGEEYIKNFTITIPEDTPYGEYWGMIGADIMPTEYENSEEGGVHLVYQLGLRTKITVTEDPKELAPADFSGGVEHVNSMIWGKYGFLMGITTCVAITIIIFLQLVDNKK